MCRKWLHAVQYVHCTVHTHMWSSLMDKMAKAAVDIHSSLSLVCLTCLTPRSRHWSCMLPFSIHIEYPFSVNWIPSSLNTNKNPFCTIYCGRAMLYTHIQCGVYDTSFSVMHLFHLKKWLKSKSIYRMFIYPMLAHCEPVMLAESSIQISRLEMAIWWPICLSVAFFFVSNHAHQFVSLALPPYISLDIQRIFEIGFAKPFASGSDAIRTWIWSLQFHSALVDAACMQKRFFRNASAARAFISCFSFKELCDWKTDAHTQMHIKYMRLFTWR